MYVDLARYWDAPAARRFTISGEPVTFSYRFNLDGVILTWKKNCGLEWCLKRFKVLKTWALQILSGNHTFSSPWIKYKHYRGYKIPDLYLFHRLVDSIRYQRVDVIREVLDVLNSYKLYRTTKHSLDSIIKPGPVCSQGELFRQLMSTLDLPKVPKVVCQRTEKIWKSTSHIETETWSDRGPTGYLNIPITEGEMFTDEREGWIFEPTVMGKLHVLPDRGKSRIILVGHKEVQHRTKRLADYLRTYAWKQPEICSNDQDIMRHWMRDKMNSRTPEDAFLSLDLSNATDRFPLSYQRFLLQQMSVPNDIIRLLDLPVLYNDRKIRYGAGQPMGLYLSFPLFEIAHLSVARFCLRPHNIKFMMCGDDLVAFGKHSDIVKGYEMYKTIARVFGFEISESKTLVSSQLVEGVGSVLYKNYDITPLNGCVSEREIKNRKYELSQKVQSGKDAIGRALYASLFKVRTSTGYTYGDRKAQWSSFLSTSLPHLTNSSLRALSKISMEPRLMPSNESSFDFFQLYDNPTKQWDFSEVKELSKRLKPVSAEQLRQIRADRRIIELMSKDMVGIKLPDDLVKRYYDASLYPKASKRVLGFYHISALPHRLRTDLIDHLGSFTALKIVGKWDSAYVI